MTQASYVDAGWSGESGTSLGCLACDSNGGFMCAATEFLTPQLDPLVAEASGLRWCMAMTQELELQCVIFESDSEILIKAMKRSSCTITIQPLVEDCKELAQCFHKVVYSRVKYEANKAAQSLASVVNLFGPRMSWDDSPAPIVLDLFADASPMNQ